METKIQNLPKNLIDVSIKISSEEMKPFSEEALKELAKNVQIAGFRRGKAPANLVAPQIPKNQILEKAAKIAIDKNYANIIKKEKLNPAGPPKVTIEKLAPDNPFEFRLTIPLIPKVQLDNWKKINIKKENIIVEEKEIETVLKQLQESKKKEKVINRPAQIGDKIDINMNLSLDKVPLENGQVKNLIVILGKDYYVPGLSANLVGLKKNDEKNFSLKFPENHYDKKMAGKNIDFHVKINEVFQIDLPIIDDDFAKNFKTKNLKELKEQIKENLLKEKKDKENRRLEDNILEKIISQSIFEEIPEVIINHELDKMVAEIKQTLASRNLKFVDYLSSIKKNEDELKKGLIPEAEKRIKIAIAIQKIAQEEKIDISPKKIEEEAEKIVNLYKDRPEIVEQFKSKAGQNYIKNLLINKKVIELLKKNCS